MKNFKTPDTYIIIFLVVVLAAVLTYLIPLGQFDTKEVKYTYQGKENSRTVPVAESFRIIKDDQGNSVREGIGLFEAGGGTGLMNYVFEGLVSGDKWGSAVGIVAFILIIGGAFGVILHTGAVEAATMAMIQKTAGKEVLMLPVLFFLFSLGGAVFGMGEEAIAFAMILVPIVIAMGYDSIVGVMITYGATQIGFATSWMNPFSVAIAQGVSEIPVMSGWTYRIAMWFVFTVVSIVFLWMYAKKIKRDPTASVAYESDAGFREDIKDKEELNVEFEIGHILVLVTLLLGVIWIIWGVVEHAYYIPEIASQFFVIGIIAGIIGAIFKLNGMGFNEIATSFQQGVRDLVGAALVVGMAKGIVLVLGGDSPSDPTVLNTLLYWAGNTIEGLHATIAAWLMFLIQSVFNFFVVSGSGQAALTMPLLAPLADIIGVTRQVAVLAFQLGDGLMNLIVPTSAALMGSLGAARLEWSHWFKFQIKFQLLLFGMGSVFVILAVLIGYK